MKVVVIVHVTVVHDFYSKVEQRAGWLYSWLPVVLPTPHKQW